MTLMKPKKYFPQIVIVILIQAFLLLDLAWAQPEQMLAPVLQIDNLVFENNVRQIINQPFIDPSASISDRIIRTRQAYAQQSKDKDNLSLWPKFFLKHVLEPTTDTLKAQMEKLIKWMHSESFEGMGDIERLEYIEHLSGGLSPFEKMLFYEGVYFVEPGSNDLGFNINIRQDWEFFIFMDLRFLRTDHLMNGKTLLS